MTTVQIDPRWRAQVEGDPSAIADLERVLMGSVSGADSYVLFRQEGDVPVLTTTKWDGLADASQAQEAAETALRLFSGALNILDVCAPLSIGTIYEVKADKTFDMKRVTRHQLYVTKDVANQVTPTDFATAIQKAGQHEWLASAFIEMSGKVDWFALYRAIEAIESHLGGEKGMNSDPRLNGAKLKRTKRMANSFRHLPDGKHQPPNPPVPFDEATVLVRESLEILIKALP